ncbi:nucleoside recognition domain-containing protein [Paenibacillus oenotherae]|uniref:Nucleoside recognition domain-containing protein n=1 Tax=Paenibacillus oenotherae TaxID=1435645 RepID=A0ABS7D099_9BACL|nr:nucleoside recognition domain-containing protein [Paenibacillus oenotherae]MBW7473344.1 nucleoside recognition domain-containing protein [Paenibacillus oenotherae]
MKYTLLLACLSVTVVAAIIVRPDEAFQASLQGLTVWWNIVFPGLLPFLVLLELMLAFGAVQALGALLEPLMRRLFRLPGESGIAMAAGWTGGFPAGAESAAALRRSGAVTKAEGQRILALAHMPSPLFMLLVIGSGFLKRAELGLAIALAVWLTALLAGLVHARFARNQGETLPSPGRPGSSHSNGPAGILRRAAKAMVLGRERDGRTFGKALGDAVVNSVYKLMAVGGFMMFAAVIVKLMEPAIPGIIPSWLPPGIVESHIGAYAAAAAPLPGGLAWNGASIAAILSWGGISALLQAGSAVAGTDLSIRPFAAIRFIQGILAFVVTLLLWQPLTSMLAFLLPATAAPALLQQGINAAAATGEAISVSQLPSLWLYTPALLFLFICSLLLLASCSIGLSKKRLR